MAPVRKALASFDTGAPSYSLRFLHHDFAAGSGRNGVFAGKDWFLDPVSGRCWPGEEANAFALDVRSTSANPHPPRPYGDVKFVLEMNRLQVLQPLACCIAREGIGGPALARSYGLDPGMDGRQPSLQGA